jgi:glycine cleavage system aminomethyltransferase T
MCGFDSIGLDRGRLAQKVQRRKAHQYRTEDAGAGIQNGLMCHTSISSLPTDFTAPEETVQGYVGRVSFTGELGFEIWLSTDYQRALYDLLVGAGRKYDLRPFGGRALNCMRVEKSFGTWTGYVPAAIAGATSGFEIEIIGERHHAQPLSEAAYDAKGSRMRA